MKAIQDALDCLKNGNRTWEAMGILEKALAASKPAPQAQGEPEDDLTIAYMAGFSKGKDQMRQALAETERKAAYWQEEARRYAGNADFWREKCAAKDAALEKCVAQLVEDIAEIAHCGGLIGLSEHGALTLIRKLTLAHWKKERTEEESRAALTKIKEARG